MMRSRRAFVAASLMTTVVMAMPLAAQTPADSSIFARAQRMVADGDAARGRAIVDSVLATISTSSPRYAEALFWHASIAPLAADAERDYRRIAVEYSLSPRVPDALTRLAQLELARGDRTLAARHLERLLREYPPPPARATAWYWLARIGFEDNDVARACIALDSARALAPASNAELTNQVRYESARCLTAGSISTSRADARAAVTPSPSARPAAPAATYSVQVGAFPTRQRAESLRSRLARRGYIARVTPAGAVFRVRVGRYPTRVDAQRAAAKLKAAKIDAWVVDAEPSA
jgi:cell division septation protein DedD